MWDHRNYAAQKRYGILFVAVAAVTTVVVAVTSDWLQQASRETALARAAVPDSMLASGRLLVSLSMNPFEIDELLTNPQQRGRNWERPATVVFARDGEFVFGTTAGVRVHGGFSRGDKEKSYRLYFRRSYQSDIPDGPSVGLEGPPRGHERLVLHNDQRGASTGGRSGRVWHYVNPLAYDISSAIGAIVPQTEPATLIVNAGRAQPYVVTEYIDLDFLEARYGHRDFDLHRTSTRLASADPLSELEARFGAQDSWTLAQIDQVVDVDNMSRWFLSILICGTFDAWQGTMVRDRSRSDGRWFWINWDMDSSFGRPFPDVPDIWERVHLMEAVMDETDRHQDTRYILLRHLFRNSPEYGERFIALFDQVVNERLTEEFMERTLSRYERLSHQHGIEDTGYHAAIREYLTHRPAAVRARLIADLQPTPSS